MVTLNLMVEERLEQLVAEWKQQGSRNQEPIDWSKTRSNWMRDLPQLSEFIGLLPSKLNRSEITRIFDDHTSTVEAKLATVMIWGYGTVGYGSYRVSKMFDSSGFSRKIYESYELSQNRRPLECYAYLSKNKIDWLGPAFATKWIAFASPKHYQSPIYDSFISKWFQVFGSEVFLKSDPSSLLWNLQTFTVFFHFMQEQSSKLQVSTDQLEMIIFRDAMRNIPNQSRWRNL